MIEFLTFAVAADELDEWLAVDDRTWTRFLETCPGFVRKEVWAERGQTSTVHAVIWWTDDDSWRSVGSDTVARVDAEMGSLARTASCRTFDVRVPGA